MSNVFGSILKALVTSGYDFQKLRISIGNRMCQIFRQRFLELSSNEKLIPSEIETKIRTCGAIITPKVDALLTKFGMMPPSEDKPKQVKIRLAVNEILNEMMLHEFKRITDTIITLSCTAEEAAQLRKKKIEIVLQYINQHVNKKTIEKAIRETNSLVVDNMIVFNIIATYLNTLSSEEGTFKQIEYILDNFPIWSEFMYHVKGIGPLMGGILISKINIIKSESVSALWKFCGLDVAEDGKARSMREEHLVPKSYINSDGEEDMGKFCAYSPWFKSKIGYVMADCLIKQNKVYKKVYDDYKNRLINDPNRVEHKITRKTKAGKEYTVKVNTPGHFNMMARRYMVKMFLQDMWLCWRKLEGLEVKPPYCAKLGLTPHYRYIDPDTKELVEA